MIYRGIVCSEGKIIELNSLTKEIIDQEKEITEWIETANSEKLSPEKKINNLNPASGLLGLDEAEKLSLQSALELSSGSFPDAAKRLGVSRATLYRKAKKHSINE